MQAFRVTGSLIASTSKISLTSAPQSISCTCSFSTFAPRSRRSQNSFSAKRARIEEKRQKLAEEVYGRYDGLADLRDETRSTERSAPSYNASESSSTAAQPSWALHRAALKAKFPDGWNPPRKVQRSDMNTIRRLHSLDPTEWSTPNLANRFKISPEAVRRILSSKYRTAEEDDEERIGAELEQQASDGTSHSADIWAQEARSAEVPSAYSRKRAVPLRAGFEPDSSDRWTKEKQKKFDY